MDSKKLFKILMDGSNPNILDYVDDASETIKELLIENQSLRIAANGFKDQAKKAEERAEKAENIISDLCDDFTDFVIGGVPNAAPYCANRREKCVDGRGWCDGDNRVCKGFFPKAARVKEE